jgi:hypothetical protein
MRDTLTDSVEMLYALYHKDIVSFFADHLADRETSWDLCHEVFLRLLLTLGWTGMLGGFGWLSVGLLACGLVYITRGERP